MNRFCGLPYTESFKTQLSVPVIIKQSKWPKFKMVIMQFFLHPLQPSKSMDSGLHFRDVFWSPTEAPNMTKVASWSWLNMRNVQNIQFNKVIDWPFFGLFTVSWQQADCPAQDAHLRYTDFGIFGRTPPPIVINCHILLKRSHCLTQPDMLNQVSFGTQHWFQQNLFLMTSTQCNRLSS